jgi:exonuclease SbcD
MKLLHLSDLHLGKRMNEFSLLEDQTYILDEILSIVDAEAPDGILLAGDIYDKSMPSAEAVALFDRFLGQLARRGQTVCIISGNHDSPERLAFGSSIMAGSGIHLSPVYDGTVTPVTLEDAFGPVDIFLLPFLKPAQVRRFFPDAEITSYTDALACAIDHLPLEPDHRSVLVTHQFVTGASRCDSEEVSVGGSDNVDAAVFAPFSYVALGHIHGPQNVGTEHIRYCGTPLKYSFSEARQEKSVTVVELGAGEDLTIRTVPLHPLRDLLEIRGTYLDVTARSFYEQFDREAYLHVTLTDEEDVPEALGRLRVIYPRLARLDYDNHRTRATTVLTADTDLDRKSPLTLFSEFYQQQNDQPMSDEQTVFVTGLMEKIWGEQA